MLVRYGRVNDCIFALTKPCRLKSSDDTPGFRTEIRAPLEPSYERCKVRYIQNSAVSDKKGSQQQKKAINQTY